MSYNKISRYIILCKELKTKYFSNYDTVKIIKILFYIIIILIVINIIFVKSKVGQIYHL